MGHQGAPGRSAPASSVLAGGFRSGPDAELAQPEGAEFNLLEIGRHIPAESVTAGSEVKCLLAAHKMVYLGAVNADRDVRFGAEDLRGATHLLVLSLGDL